MAFLDGAVLGFLLIPIGVALLFPNNWITFVVGIAMILSGSWMIISGAAGE